MSVELNEKERVCHEVHRLSIEALLSRRKEPYTILIRESGWLAPPVRAFWWGPLRLENDETPLALWQKLCPKLHCTINFGGEDQPKFVVLFGHHSYQEVSEILGFADFTLKQVLGRHHMDLPFLPCNM